MKHMDREKEMKFHREKEPRNGPFLSSDLFFVTNRSCHESGFKPLPDISMPKPAHTAPLPDISMPKPAQTIPVTRSPVYPVGGGIYGSPVGGGTYGSRAQKR
jgi:hypothetical protein